MIDLDVFTPSDDRAVRLVVGKTADQSTAARKDVQQTEQGGRADRRSTGASPSPDGVAHQIAGTQAPPVDTFFSTQPQGDSGTDAQEGAAVKGESTGGENVDPHDAQIIDFSDVALAGEGRGADSVALGSAVEPGAPKFPRIPHMGTVRA